MHKQTSIFTKFKHFCYLRNDSLPDKISASLANYRNRTLEETLGNSYCKLTVFS